MKTSFQFLGLLCVAIATLTFAGCGDDDPTLNEKIQGEWIVFNWINEGEVVDLTEVDRVSFEFSSTGANEGAFIFSVIGMTPDDNDVVLGGYTLDGNQITMQALDGDPGDPSEAIGCDRSRYKTR
jgi:hypothetical protein